jgi:hypothetical protein
MLKPAGLGGAALAVDDSGAWTDDWLPLCVRLWRLGQAEGGHCYQRSYGLRCELAPFNTKTPDLFSNNLAFHRHAGSFAVEHGRESNFYI